MHILFLTDNFPPETNAPASRTYEHTQRWVQMGYRVTVVTGVPNFPAGKVFAGYRNRLFQREWRDGIEVIRVWTYITANQGFLKRTLDYLSFMVSAVIAGLLMRRPDVIVATSPQFFTAVAGFLLSRLKRRPFVFELRDLWPDSIVAVGAMKESRLIRLLRRWEYFLYRRAARIVSVTQSFKAILCSNGIASEHITVVRNGVDLQAFQPGDRPQALVQELGLSEKFIAAYVGTLGMAHGLGALLQAAEQLRGRRDIAFILVGTGAEKNALMDEVARRQLDNVHFIGAVDKEKVKEYWRLADVALVLLRDTPLFSHVIPSKMFEAMGTARPIILGVRGEAEEILKAAGAGIAVPPEDAEALLAAITRLADNAEQRVAMGMAGRRFVQTHYDRDQLAEAMLAVLQEVAEDTEVTYGDRVAQRS
jgi:glycosyltransferase involved in cell wall biosynthesis